MSAVYEDLRTEWRPDARTLHLTVRLRNDASGAWRAAEGFRVGWQILDAASGTLVAEGARVAPAADVAPGASLPAEFDIPLPREPGRYEVLVSPMIEGQCWYRERGWWFVLVEAEVTQDAARVGRARVTTQRRRAATRVLRTCGRAFTYPVLTIWRHRSLIRTMVRRDILGRYRGSFGGALWTVVNPLLLMLTYFFVFGVVLRARFAGDESRAGFALYFLAGMLPWLAFREAAGRAPTVMLEYRGFVKKLVFAVETLPVNLVAAALVTELVAAVLFAAGVWLARGGLPASAAWLPVLLVPQVLFTLGVCWFLAALGVFVRDLGQVIGFALTLWFFLTPICYPEASLPPAAAPLLAKNPMFVLVRAYRAIFLEGHAPAWAALWKLYALAAVVFVAGHAWFHKLRRSFADLL
jgi:lipopolysaccharide transport system permease protein